MACTYTIFKGHVPLTSHLLLLDTHAPTPTHAHVANANRAAQYRTMGRGPWPLATRMHHAEYGA
jgi:hypothetical protein